jgi:Ca2+-binding EF-hand superfamily protein
VVWGHVAPAPGGGPAWGDLDADGDGKATRDEVAAFYRTRGFGGPVFASARTAVPQKLSDALRAKLDTDRDGKVTEAELLAAPKALAPLDANADELVSAAELVPGLRYPGAAPALVTEPVAAAAPDPDGKRPSIVPLNAAARGEAAEVWTARLGTRATGAPALECGARAGEHFAVAGPRERWEVRAEPSARAADEVAAASKSARRTFTESDADGDGRLDGVELEKPAALGLKFLLPFADRDGDARLARAELDAWLDLQVVLARGAVVVGVTDLGAGLFELLDADRDGALSPREVRSAADRVRAAGALKDGALDPARLPRHAVATVGRGRPSPELPAPVRSGPEWFRAMDRNGDGDVSAAEFLGGAAAFQRLDANGDGLLSPAEAARAAPKK